MKPSFRELYGTGADTPLHQREAGGVPGVFSHSNGQKLRENDVFCGVCTILVGGPVRLVRRGGSSGKTYIRGMSGGRGAGAPRPVPCGYGVCMKRGGTISQILFFLFFHRHTSGRPDGGPCGYTCGQKAHAYLVYAGSRGPAPGGRRFRRLREQQPVPGRR